ncbi:hypothetical protein B0H13DRAFT_2364301 [Mycena leptocephala]|nr:hypothetical protein B0H13DRAFT_2364301 [Mycena leptocephala]
MISTLGRALALLAPYLQASALVSYVGFYGALKHNPSHVRFYRDCSAADLALTVLLTVLAAYAYAAPFPATPGSSRSSPPARPARTGSASSATTWLSSRSSACSSSSSSPRTTRTSAASRARPMRGCSMRAWCASNASGSEPLRMEGMGLVHTPAPPLPTQYHPHPHAHPDEHHRYDSHAQYVTVPQPFPIAHGGYVPYRTI